MADLAFRVVGAAALEHAATPIVVIRAVVRSVAPVRAVLLRCLVRIDVASRAYDAKETRDLEPVLGPADRRVTAPLVWANLAANLPAFDGELGFDLELPCSLDLRTGAAAYLDALEGGDIPLTLFFSGTVFHGGEGGALTARPISGAAEVKTPLAVAVCREALVRHHGDATLLPVRREVLARLRRFAAERPTVTLDDAVARLLDLAEAGK